MAAREINMNPDVLQDVTITTARFLLPPISSSQAALYDAAVTMCDGGGQVALAGSMNSPVAAAVSLVCPKLPHCSAYSASPLLSNKEAYPLFYRFAVRITEQIQAAVAQHKYFGWTHIGVVYSKSAVWPLSAKLSQQLFPANGISVVASVSMTLYDPSASQTYYPQIKSAFEFLRSTKLRIFLALADTWQTMDIMMAAHRVNLVGRDYVWTHVGAAIDDPSIHERWDTPLDASLLQGVGYIRFTTGPFFTDPYLQAWLPRFQSTVAWAVANEPQLYQDLRLNETDTTQQDHPTNFFFDDPGTNQLPSYMVLAGYDATLGMAQAFEKLISESGTTGQALANGSLTSRLTLDRMLAPLQGAKSLTGMTTFTPQGDPVVNPLTFNLFRGTALTDLGILAANITLDAATGNGVFSPDKSVFVWPGNRSIDDVPIDYPPQVLDYVSAQSGSTIGLLAISAVVFTVLFISGFILLRSEETPALRRYSPGLTAYMTFGLAIMQLDGLTMVGKDKPNGCALRPWPVVMGLTLVAASMVAKAYRYLGIFGFMIGRHFSNMKALSRAYVNLQFLALCAVPIAALVCINAASPIVNHEMYSGSSSVLHFVCIASPTSSILLALAIAWIILLLAAALILAYITRTIPEEFNNSSKAATAVGLIALLSVFCLIQDSSGQFVQTQFIVEEASTAIGGLALFILLAVPTLQLSIVYHLANQQRVAPKTSRFGASSSRRISSYRRPISSGSGDGNQQPKQSTDRKMRLSELRLEMFKAQRGFLLRADLLALVLLRQRLGQWRKMRVTLFPQPAPTIRLVDSSNGKVVHLRLSALRAVTSSPVSPYLESQCCEMLFGKTRLRIHFTNPVVAWTWVDTVSSVLLTMHECVAAPKENEVIGASFVTPL